jgi:hypothetical protein
MAAESKSWRCVLELSADRTATGGRAEDLSAAIRGGADLQVGTAFRHNEHICPGSDNDDLILETMTFPVTYVLDGRWIAGVCTLRQPVSLPDGFGPRASMSFFLYNQDGRQAIARPFLEGPIEPGHVGPAPFGDHSDMPKYIQFDNWDADTNCPSHNFAYEFDYFRFCVRDRWREALHHAPDGTVLSGSADALTEAMRRGGEVKIAVSGLCDDLGGSDRMAQEVIVPTIARYYYTAGKVFIAASQPLVRVAPSIPLCYKSQNWDFGWIVARTDGQVARLLYDPYTLKPRRDRIRCSIRWFVDDGPA